MVSGTDLSHAAGRPLRLPLPGAGVTQRRRSARVCSRVTIGIPQTARPHGAALRGVAEPRLPTGGDGASGVQGSGAELLGAVPCRCQRGTAAPCPVRAAPVSPRQTAPCQWHPQPCWDPTPGLSSIFGVNPTGLGLSDPTPATATGPGCNQSPGSSECLCCERGASAGGSLEKSSVLGTWVRVPKKTAVFRRRFPNS